MVPRENIHVSQHNFRAEVTAGWHLPASIVINDVTLREGEQGSEVTFSLDEKIEFARLLDAAGVPQIEIGWAGKTASDREAIKVLKSTGLRAKLQALVQFYLPPWREECERCLDCGVDIIGLLHPTSAMRLARLDGMTPAQMVERTALAVDFVVRRGGQVGFVPVDATRSEIEVVIEASRAAAEAGASRIIVPDTAGGAMPGAMRFITAALVKEVGVPVHVHCHNDYGVGLANTLAAVEAGAAIVDGSVNGLGERGGNTALDELAVALELMYGLPTGIDLAQLFSLSRAAERLSGVRLPLNKPLVGDNAFAHKLDVHLRGVLDYPPLFETIPPDLVGNRRKLCLGGHTGPLVVRKKLEELGVSGTDAQIEWVTAMVRERAMQKRAELDDTEFLVIYQQALSST